MTGDLFLSLLFIHKINSDIAILNYKMCVSELFDAHGIARVSIWTDQHQVVSFSADDTSMQPLYLSEEASLELEEEVLEFLKGQKCHGYNIFDFERSKGVVYIKEDGTPNYAGDVIQGEDYYPFLERWLNKNDLELMIYSSK